jgi:uncharacterized membrane protein
VRLRLAICALALLGAAIAAYLTWTKVADVAVACPTSGCEVVQRSSYAELAGLPISVFGLLAYLVVFASALVRGLPAAAAGAAVALAGAVFSVYLVVVQAFVLDAFCLWCVASDVLMVVLAVLASMRLLRSAA